jgi:hypothetical protein
MTHRRSLRVAMTLASFLASAATAHADLKVRMPQVEYGELEFEHNGLVSFAGKNSPLNHAQSYTNEIGYGLLPWWQIELEGEMASGGGQHLTWNAVTLENIFQITEPGEYFFNLGFFVEYAQSTLRGQPSNFAAGPIVQKELNDVFGIDSLHTLNLVLGRDVGHDASKSTGMQIAWQSVAEITPLIAPGFEYYGIIDDIAHPGPASQQQHLIGPVLTGGYSLAPYGKLKYEVGYLFGLTPAAGRGAVRWRLEYEMSF